MIQRATLAMVLVMVSGVAHASSYSEGMKALAADRPNEAYALLDQVEVRDPNFVSALTELQKLNYKRQDWQKFFGYAAFYRSRFLSSPELLKRHYNGMLIALEVLALVKHCRFGDAGALAQAALRASARLKAPDQVELQKLINHLDLQKAFPKALAGREQTNRPQFLGKEMLWKMKSDQIELIDHPRSLRMLVQSSCEGSK